MNKFTTVAFFVIVTLACRTSTVTKKSGSSAPTVISTPGAPLGRMPITSRPANIPVYTPSSSSISASALINWLTQKCTSGVKEFGIAPGTYTIDNSILYPSVCATSTFWLDRVNFLFTNINSNMLTLNTAGVTIRGGTFQYQTIPFSQATITSINQSNSFTFQVQQGYPTQWWMNGANTFNFSLMNAATRSPILSVNSYIFGTPISQGNSPNTFTATNIDTTGFSVGDSIVVRSTPFSFCFNISGGNNTIADVTMYNCNGFGIYDNGRGRNTYTNFYIVFPPDNYPGTIQPPLLTSAADMFHSNAYLGPIVDHCYFEGSNDDGIAIQGMYLQATSGSGSTVTFANNNYGSVESDAIRVYDESYTYQDSYSITTINGSTFGLSAALPSNFNANTWWFVILEGDGYSITNTYIGAHQGRGMLLKSSNGTISHNTITGASFYGIDISPEPYWGEADYTWNLNITDNIINNSPVAFFMGGAGATPLTGHRNINIQNNQIQGIDGAWFSKGSPLVQLAYVNGVTFKDNVISNPGNCSAVVGAINVVDGLFSGNCISTSLPSSIVPINLTNSSSLTSANLPVCEN